MTASGVKHTFKDCSLMVFAAAAFEISIVMSCFFRGISYFTVDEHGVRSIIGQNVGPWDMIWSLMFIACTPVVMYAIFKPNVHLRVLGLMVLGIALTMAFAAGAAINPDDPRNLANLLPGLGCFLKVYMFWTQYEFKPRNKSA